MPSSSLTEHTQAELSAASWSCIEFLSDLHLHEGPTGARTAAAFLQHLHTTQADALFLLGDVFEVWVGDDAAQAGTFEANIGDALRQCRAQLYFMAGNRDFLLGDDFAQHARLQRLQDPCCLDLGAQRWLLTHGDAWCIDDVDYQRFRTQVRSTPWQQALLARPLAERQAIARTMREASSSKQASMVTHADVDHATALAAMHACGAHVLLHGHTHRPAIHHMQASARAPAQTAQSLANALLPDGTRVVLSDWDLDDASHPRADFVRLHRQDTAQIVWHAERGQFDVASKSFTMQPLHKSQIRV